MDIKTKHNIGDAFWFMEDNKPVETKVKSIHIEIETIPGGNYGHTQRIDIVYRGWSVGKSSTTPRVSEDKFYPTKQSLFDSL